MINEDKLKRIFKISLAAFLLLGFFVHTEHAVFWWEEIPVFYAIYGLFGCVLIIIASKELGHFWLQRPEDYYD
jgi:hypothetical protein